MVNVLFQITCRGFTKSSVHIKNSQVSHNCLANSNIPSTFIKIFSKIGKYSAHTNAIRSITKMQFAHLKKTIHAPTTHRHKNTQNFLTNNPERIKFPVQLRDLPECRVKFSCLRYHTYNKNDRVMKVSLTFHVVRRDNFRQFSKRKKLNEEKKQRKKILLEAKVSIA